jgi:hypothetical protein
MKKNGFVPYFYKIAYPEPAQKYRLRLRQKVAPPQEAPQRSHWSIQQWNCLLRGLLNAKCLWDPPLAI